MCAHLGGGERRGGGRRRGLGGVEGELFRQRLQQSGLEVVGAFRHLSIMIYREVMSPGTLKGTTCKVVAAAAAPPGVECRFRVQGSGFRVQDSGFRFRMQGSGFRVQGSEFRVQGSGLWTLGSEAGLEVGGAGVHERRLETVSTTTSQKCAAVPRRARI